MWFDIYLFEVKSDFICVKNIKKFCTSIDVTPCQSNPPEIGKVELVPMKN